MIQQAFIAFVYFVVKELFDPRHSERVKNVIIKVRSIEFKERITETCCDRNYECGLSVLARVNGTVSDLHATDAVYHRICSTNFRIEKNVLREFSKSNTECLNAKKIQNTFLKLKHIKHLRLEKYGENIIIGEVCGIENIITFKETAKTILHKFYQQAKDDNVEKRKERLIYAVDEILKSEMKEQSTPSYTYTNFSNLTLESSVDFLPSSLKPLLSAMLPDIKLPLVVAAVGQALMLAFRPQALLAPMQLALASDANVLTAKTAITMSRNEDTCIVGNGTDLLILLSSYPWCNGKALFFKTEKRIWDINTTK
ncbi:hypothetical protein PR048_005664 [Dryococelus australis]|uniref:Uncharacterized protein n=1 Tax=Dryococelus australis TaxID=614101 RepID=A0ABQ9I8W0_9NEOP|nr:hypothetical protein PR048_005664 [Dryococelus australis]